MRQVPTPKSHLKFAKEQDGEDARERARKGRKKESRTAMQSVWALSPHREHVDDDFNPVECTEKETSFMVVTLTIIITNPNT